MVLVCLDAELMVMLCEYDHDITCLYKYPFLAGLWNYSLEVWVHLAGRQDRAAVSWHSYPRLVHRKPPHLKEDWKLVLWFNTRTAGSSHLVTWNCKVICEGKLWNIIRHAPRLCLLLLKCFRERTSIKCVQYSPFPFNHIFSHCFLFLPPWGNSPKVTCSCNNELKLSHVNSFNNLEHFWCAWC